MSQYQKQHSPTHTHEEEEKGFAQTTESALSQRWLLDPIKPAYNQSRPYGRLKLTASAFKQLWISMPAVLIAVPTTVTQNSLHPLSTSSITARQLLDFTVQAKITGRCTNNPSGRHPILTIGAAPSPSSPYFYTECPFCRNPLNVSWLETKNNAGLHTQWLGGVDDIKYHQAYCQAVVLTWYY